eukprot:CAMPEP_0172748654 /NCGR_PEP_ID=MMETSP1074-20121228/145537_1 /TAXON_ID=2916 /ORGANISM="Ceratium fusus, Strain PA161109" /LENGTH=343 /DNA_ID=CAMNT_0013580421 /DNA_START=342 /DNA_END=1375 /DNA_ORIENTATION=+
MASSTQGGNGFGATLNPHRRRCKYTVPGPTRRSSGEAGRACQAAAAKVCSDRRPSTTCWPQVHQEHPADGPQNFDDPCHLRSTASEPFLSRIVPPVLRPILLQQPPPLLCQAPHQLRPAFQVVHYLDIDLCCLKLFAIADIWCCRAILAETEETLQDWIIGRKVGPELLQAPGLCYVVIVKEATVRIALALQRPLLWQPSSHCVCNPTSPLSRLWRHTTAITGCLHSSITPGRGVGGSIGACSDACISYRSLAPVQTLAMVIGLSSSSYNSGTVVGWFSLSLQVADKRSIQSVMRDVFNLGPCNTFQRSVGSKGCVCTMHRRLNSQLLLRHMWQHLDDILGWF